MIQTAKPTKKLSRLERLKKRTAASEYGRQLLEKQKLKEEYGLREKQFKRYVKEVLKERGHVEDAGAELVKRLESRLDNVVWRLGFARSRRHARQLVSHGHFLVNGRKVNIPSYRVKKGDVVSVKEQKKKKTFFKEALIALKKVEVPSWLKLDREKAEGKVVGEPTPEDAGVSTTEISSIFEFYSR